MKKLILSSLFVVGATFAVTAQTTTKSCTSDQGNKSCCKSSNSVSTTTTTNTSTTKSCCSMGGNHHASTNNEGPRTSTALAKFSATKSVAEANLNTEAPKNK